MEKIKGIIKACSELEENRRKELSKEKRKDTDQKRDWRVQQTFIICGLCMALLLVFRQEESPRASLVYFSTFFNKKFDSIQTTKHNGYMQGTLP